MATVSRLAAGLRRRRDEAASGVTSALVERLAESIASNPAAAAGLGAELLRAHTGRVQDDPYASVPDVDEDAEVDPFWQELRNPTSLPPIYMPASMAGRYTPRQRAIAASLIGIFVLGAGLGVCLTYGPQVLGW